MNLRTPFLSQTSLFRLIPGVLGSVFTNGKERKEKTTTKEHFAVFKNSAFHFDLESWSLQSTPLFRSLMLTGILRGAFNLANWVISEIIESEKKNKRNFEIFSSIYLIGEKKCRD